MVNGRLQLRLQQYQNMENMGNLILKVDLTHKFRYL